MMLGRATDFEVIVNAELEATLVDALLGTERRVLLLTIQGDGMPLVEDLTGQIALAAGRGPTSPIDGIDLDFESFPVSGDIGVQASPEDRVAARSDKVNLGEQIGRERARRADLAAQN